MSRIALVRMAAAFCFVAVALGAFGAHALRERGERTVYSAVRDDIAVNDNHARPWRL